MPLDKTAVDHKIVGESSDRAAPNAPLEKGAPVLGPRHPVKTLRESIFETVRPLLPTGDVQKAPAHSRECMPVHG